MVDADFPAFGQAMTAAYRYVNAPVPSNEMLDIVFDDLKDYPLEIVLAAFAAHRKDPERGHFPPRTSDLNRHVQAFIEASDGRPGAEQAWAESVKAADETCAVWWTEEMAEAWGAARAVYGEGDEVGARVCFREVYTKLVRKARAELRPAKWFGSAGTGEQKERLVETSDAGRLAVSRGLLPAPADLPALPSPFEAEKALEKLEAEAQRRAPAGTTERLRAIRAGMVAKAAAPSRDVQQRQQTQERKEQQAERAREAGVSLDECPGNVSDLMALAKARAARLAQGGGEKAA